MPLVMSLGLHSALISSIAPRRAGSTSACRLRRNTDKLVVSLFSAENFVDRDKDLLSGRRICPVAPREVEQRFSTARRSIAGRSFREGCIRQHKAGRIGIGRQSVAAILIGTSAATAIRARHEAARAPGALGRASRARAVRRSFARPAALSLLWSF